MENKKKARNIIIGNRKGGIGKSTTTIYLSNSLSLDYNKKILVIECDSQQTIFKIRKKDEKVNKGVDPPYPIIFTKPSDLSSVVKQFEYSYDYIFIDMPRITNQDDEIVNDQANILDLLLLAECILIPVTSSEVDIDGSDDFISLIKDLREFKEKRKLPLIVYAFQTKVKGVKEDKSVKEWADLRKVDLFENTIKDSISYGRYLNTYTSIKSEKSTSVPFINNYINFIDEFVEKFKI